MNLHWLPNESPSVIRRGGIAGLTVVALGLAFDSPTVVLAGLLTLILATHAAISTGNRCW